MSTRIKIDSNWRFQLGDINGAHESVFDDSTWRQVNLPHDWSIEGSFTQEHFIEARYYAKHLEGRADSYLPKGTGWYRKHLTIDKAFTDKKVYIEFEGVFRNSTLWVNGQRVGNHLSGYTGVVYDITLWVNSNGAPNILAVQVDAREMEGWWYEGAGIYRHVWLMVKPYLHLAPWGIAVTTTNVSYSSAVVNVRTRLLNSVTKTQRARLHTTVEDDQGNLVGTVETETGVDAAHEAELIQEITVADPHLWSPEHPRLYRVSSELNASGSDVDSRETFFGIRWFEFTPDKGFFLNGKPLKLRGGNIHHDFGGLGTALPDRANFRTVEVLKEMGCNIIRSAHNPASPSLMDACDRLGMLFWAETRNLYPDNGAFDDLRDLILRDRNHPCIIVWGLANTAGSNDERLTNHLRQLNELAHQLDSSRPTVVGLEGNADANANGFAGVTDVVGYNGGGIGIDDRDHRLFPGRKMLISEFSSGRGARGVYMEAAPADSESETLGDGRVMKRGGHYCSEFELCRSHEQEWRHVAARPWLAGGLMWSAIE
ncbi:MAG: sugar-binding domain-containing protein, partial [Lentisphaerota bacterium]